MVTGAGGGGGGVTIRVLLMLWLVVTSFFYLAIGLWIGQGGALPQTSWGALIVLVFMAGGVFFAGLPVRRFLRGQSTKSLNPMRAMRTLVLAQAAALTGALVAGWYVAQALVLLPDFEIASIRTMVIRLAGLAAGGVLLATAGLVTQRMCRVDHDRRNDNRADNRDDEEESGSSYDR